MSACSDSQSTILPFPSSPPWDPTTTTLAMRRLSSASAVPGIISKRQRYSPPFGPRIRGSYAPGELTRPRRSSPSAAQLPDFAGLIHPLPSPTLSTANELALSKEFWRQPRGGEDFAPSSSAAEYRAGPSTGVEPPQRRRPFAGRWGRHQALTQQSMPNVKQFTSAGGVVFHV